MLLKTNGSMRKPKRKLKNTCRHTTMQIQSYKICEMPQKHFLEGSSEAFLRGKFIMIQAFLKKEEKSQINKLTYHLKELEKRTNKTKVNRRKENKDQRGNKYNRNLKKTVGKKSM